MLENKEPIALRPSLCTGMRSGVGEVVGGTAHRPIGILLNGLFGPTFAIIGYSATMKAAKMNYDFLKERYGG
jgi:hypothetical protein